MKVFLKIVILAALIIYLIVAVTKFNKPDSSQLCKRVELNIEDSAKVGFITVLEMERILKKEKIYPLGKRMDFIDSRKIETVLMKNPLIENAQCYKTAGDEVKITITQRLPVMRIMSDNGDNYFIDKKGQVLLGLNYPADLVVATGAISKKYARRNLVRIGKFLQTNPFWNDQIEQIHVDKNGNIEMIPRVGDHIIYLGRPLFVQRKLTHLKVFYRKVLSEVGWNKYSRINLEFNNQIICTKK